MWVSLCFYDNLMLKLKFKAFGVEKKASRSEVVCKEKPFHNLRLRAEVNLKKQTHQFYIQSLVVHSDSSKYISSNIFRFKILKQTLFLSGAK